MAEVSFSIGGRGYRLACRDGEENALLAAAELLDSKVSPLVRAHGQISEPRLLLMGALQLAGELNEERRSSARPDDSSALPPDATASLEKFAQRAEALADRLEKAVANT